MSKVPEYVETFGRDGAVVGYVRSADIFEEPGPKGPEKTVTPPVPVYAADLSTMVGHMYPGYGFVRLGEKPPTSADS